MSVRSGARPGRSLRSLGVEISRYFLDHADLPVEAGEAPPSPSSYLGNRPRRSHQLEPGELRRPSLSPAQLREILCDCKLGRVILGPDSQPLDVGREHRTTPRYMPRAIAARDKGCRYPGCGRKPSRCKAHHVIPWDPDGETKISNLVLLCQFHHGVIHRRGWTNTFDGITYTVTKPDGTIETSALRLRQTAV